MRLISRLFDQNLCARCSLACEEAFLYLFELYDTVFCGVDSEVTAHECAISSTLGHANLTNDYLTGLNFLTTVQLDAKALAG